MMKNWKRCLSVVMTLAMLVGVLPTAAFAEEGVEPQSDPISVTDLTISLAEGQTSEFSYTGSAPAFEVKSTNQGIIFTASDYDLIDEDSGTVVEAVNVGSYTLQAKLKGSYSGTSTNSVTFTIKQAAWPVTDVTVTETNEYNGSTPTVNISGGTEGSYSVTYKKGEETLTAAPVDVGSYSVVVAPTANYTGEAITKSFTITAKPWSVDSIQVTGADSEGNLTYSGSVAAIQVLDASNNAVPDTEYMLTYQKGTETLSAAPSNVGSYTVTASPTANYSGSAVSKSFTIAAKTLTAPTVEDITDQTYTGSAITPKLTVKDGETTLTEDTDYTVSYSNNANAAESTAENAPTATVTFKGNYTGDPVTKTFTIDPKDIKDANMGNLLPAYKPGSTPEPVLSLSGYGLLRESTDYDLTWSGTETLTVTATGKGNFSGTVTATVPVLDDTTAPGITGVTGGETYYEEKTITVTDDNLYKVFISHGEEMVEKLTPDAEGEVTYTLTFANAPYTIVARDKVDNVTSITVTVTKKSIASSMITIADADNIVYDGTAKTPTITVKDGTTTIAADQYTLSWENNTNAGTATVKVTMNSDSNYQGEATKTFTIKPKTITSSSAIEDIADQTYTGSPLTPTITVKDGTTTLVMGSDKDYTVSYSNNTNPGTAVVKVTLDNNYSGILYKTFTIGQDLSALITNIETLAGDSDLDYGEKQQIKQLKAAYDALSATDKATVDNAVGSTLMTSFKSKASAAKFKLLNLPSLGYYRYTKGTSSNVVIKIDADYSRTIVTEIRMGKNLTVIDPEYYEVTEGSVVVTLKSSYLKKIKDTGKYNLYIDLTDTETGHTETVQTVVRVLPATDIPQTSDPFKMNLWIGLLGASVLALAGLGVYEVVKRKKKAQKRLEAAMDLGDEPSDEANANE